MALEVAASGKSERDRALELKKAVRAKVTEILPLMDEANRGGMRIEFDLGVDAFGRDVIQRLALIKEIG